MKKHSAISVRDFTDLLSGLNPELTPGEIVDIVSGLGIDAVDSEEVFDAIRDLSPSSTNPADIDIDSPDVLPADDAWSEEGGTLGDDIGGPDLGLGGASLMDDLSMPADGVDSFEADGSGYTDDEIQDLEMDFRNNNPDATDNEVRMYLDSIGAPPSTPESSFRSIMTEARSIGHEDQPILVEDAVSSILEMDSSISIDALRQGLERIGVPPVEIEQVLNKVDIPGDGSDWYSLAEQIMQQNPQATPEEIMDELASQGATPEEVDATVNSLSNTFDEGQELEEGQRISSVISDDIWGAHYRLTNGEVIDHDEAVRRFEASFKQAKESDIVREARVFAESTPIEDTFPTRLTSSQSGALRTRLVESSNMREKIRHRIAGHPEASALDTVNRFLEREASWIREVLSSSFTDEEVEYANSSRREPGYVSDYDISGFSSPLGDDSFLSALASNPDSNVQDDYSLKVEVTAGADLFVSRLHPSLISDTGAVRRAASKHIRTKTAHLKDRESDDFTNLFLANVEKSRRERFQLMRRARRDEVRRESKQQQVMDDDTLGGLFL